MTDTGPDLKCMTFLDCWKVLIPSNLISSEKMVICHFFGIKVCKFIHDFLVSWFWTLKVSRVMLRKLNYGLNFIFTPLSNLFHSCGDVTIVNKGLRNLGFCPALIGAGIIIVPHRLWHGVCDFAVLSFHSKDHAHPFSPLEWQAKGSNPDPTWLVEKKILERMQNNGQRINRDVSIWYFTS